MNPDRRESRHRRSCLRKSPYPTAEAAIRGRLVRSGIGGVEYRTPPPEPYRCDYCPYYHLGHPRPDYVYVHIEEDYE